MLRVLALSMLLAAAAVGQTAQITGLISDPTGNAVPAARVSVRNVETGISTQTVTSEQGYYTLQHLNPGTYELSILKPGFKTATRADIKLDVAQIARVDVALVIGEVRDTVTVTAEAPVL